MLTARCALQDPGDRRNRATEFRPQYNTKDNGETEGSFLSTDPRMLFRAVVCAEMNRGGHDNVPVYFRTGGGGASIDQGTLGRYERAERNPIGKYLFKITAILNDTSSMAF